MSKKSTPAAVGGNSAAGAAFCGSLRKITKRLLEISVEIDDCHRLGEILQRAIKSLDIESFESDECTISIGRVIARTLNDIEISVLDVIDDLENVIVVAGGQS